MFVGLDGFVFVFYWLGLVWALGGLLCCSVACVWFCCLISVFLLVMLVCFTWLLVELLLWVWLLVVVLLDFCFIC